MNDNSLRAENINHSILTVKNILLLLLTACLFSGCASSTIESRRTERAAAYEALPADQRAMVDSGLIQVGMTKDAVYIAWGAPSESLQSENESGKQDTWLYHGTVTQETRYWTYREVTRNNATYLERYIDREYIPRDYVKAEIIFVGGKVSKWRTLPRPLT